MPLWERIISIIVVYFILVVFFVYLPEIAAANRELSNSLLPLKLKENLIDLPIGRLLEIILMISKYVNVAPNVKEAAEVEWCHYNKKPSLLLYFWKNNIFLNKYILNILHIYNI